MCKLLNAGFFKLRKSKIFWAMIIATVLISIIAVILETKTDALSQDNLDIILSENLRVISFIIIMFIILFTGNEYSERNN